MIPPDQSEVSIQVTHRPSVTLNGRPEELLGRGEDAGQDEVDGGALVEQLEPPVVDGD